MSESALIGGFLGGSAGGAGAGLVLLLSCIFVSLFKEVGAEIRQRPAVKVCHLFQVSQQILPNADVDSDWIFHAEANFLTHSCLRFADNELSK